MDDTNTDRLVAAILACLVNQAGGRVVLTEEQLNSLPSHGMVRVTPQEDGLVLQLVYDGGETLQ